VHWVLNTRPNFRASIVENVLFSTEHSATGDGCQQKASNCSLEVSIGDVNYNRIWNECNKCSKYNYL
jgi:hypothetical protein